MRAGRGWIFGIAAIAVVALPAGASADVFCDYVDAGPAGPAGNVLAVTASGEPDLLEPAPAPEGDDEEEESRFAGGVRVAPRRDGVITVTDPGGSPVPCSGGEPTVTNVDQIRVVAGMYPFVFVDLAEARLAPGATDEGDGSSEIEVAFAGAYGVLAVRGGDGSDRFAASGPDRDERFGVNLNPGTDGEDPDLDLTLGEYTFLALFGAAGDDRFTVETPSRAPEEELEVLLNIFGGAGDDAIIGAFGRESEAVGGSGDDLLRAGPSGGRLEGGPGDDELHAGPAGAYLQGGGGHDALFGGAANDRLEGEGGRDRLIGRGGNDSILAEDGGRDWIDCGPGHDRVLKSDHADRRRRCEPWRRDSGPTPSQIEQEVAEAIEEAQETAEVIAEEAEVEVEQVGR